MIVTFSFSMFMSNTATSAMMLGMITPLLNPFHPNEPFAKSLLLGTAFAANLGGMGTIIGSPPNAIAAGALAEVNPVSFVKWMIIGMPPAIFLTGVVYIYLILRYPTTTKVVDTSCLTPDNPSSSQTTLWQRLLVFLTFIITIGLWMTGPLHGVPTPVISFIPITIFTMVGVISATEIRNLYWDVLLLIAGGLALGVGISETGLAKWVIETIPLSRLGGIGLGLGLAYLCSVLSNFMSNTAAANILVPIGLAISIGFEVHVVAPLALAASAAMCMPISTPPNAIVSVPDA